MCLPLIFVRHPICSDVMRENGAKIIDNGLWDVRIIAIGRAVTDL
jgi:hypothetical protein